MFWCDNHCDVLYQLWKRVQQTENLFEPESASPNWFIVEDSPLDVSLTTMQQNNVILQNFAIFVPDRVQQSAVLAAALKQIDLFYEQVEPYVPLLQRGEMDTLQPRSILSLEGAEALGREIENLRNLYRLGVRQIGLTWNHANLLADGCMEKRNGGLTKFGRECVAEMARLGIVVDVSHLSERSFWEVVEIPGVKLVASHSNTQAYCPHPRNLTDEQIKAIIACKCLICITFVPGFVYCPGKDARIHHLLRHIDHIAQLGGEQQLAFGSDFDGIETKIPQLETTKDLSSFSQFLLHHFPEKLVTAWCCTNAYKFYKQLFV